jgi:phenylacetic acid degradation operon negative regulatory protein
LPVRVLVRTAALFGISEGAARVALSRLAADGEVETAGGQYRLSLRHLQRQAEQDAALRPPARAWDGGWELLTGISGAPVAARRRMAALGPGLWARPANLDLPEPELPAGSTWWRARPAAGDLPEPSRLWDLERWARQARQLGAGLEAARSPAPRLAAAAAVVRHVRSDPLLPPELLPPGWPGPELRDAYDSYRLELGRLIADLRD